MTCTTNKAGGAPLGALRTYGWRPSSDLKTPEPGDLFVTSSGYGYLIADTRPSKGKGTALDITRVTVVVVDPQDPRLAHKLRHRWVWRKSGPSNKEQFHGS